MFKGWNLIPLFFLISCGGFHTLSGTKELANERQIASMAIERLIMEEDHSFEDDIEDKLLSLHCYYVIALKFLNQFDDSLKEVPLRDLYRGETYLSLLALKTQIDEIEKEFKDLQSVVKGSKKEAVLQKKFSAFLGKWPLAHLSLENLSERLGLHPSLKSVSTTSAEIEKEYAELEKIKVFQIYEKNIEHLSHLMEMDLNSPAKKWAPSENSNGSLSGQEFPSKVWSLTFSSGPHKNYTRKVIQNLKELNLKATFFHEGSKVKEFLEEAKQVSQSGMEIGTQSFSNKELSKVGLMTLEKEISIATETMENELALDIKFFRLPYGSGIEVPTVRQMIAKNKLIHVFWNIDSLDWPPQSPDRIIERTKQLMKKTPRDAGVILFHDVHSRSVAASKGIMDHLKLDARRVCTLGTIVKEMNQGQKTVCSQKSL
jgi:peptidoglycan/xylan/chitin deacetylase (PgdA/CDA1 family)